MSDIGRVCNLKSKKRKIRIDRAEAEKADEHSVGIKIMGRKGQKPWDDHATTVWLASEQSKPKNCLNCKPFGWAELCKLNPLAEEEFKDLEQKWIEEKRSQLERLDGVTLKHVHENEIHKPESVSGEETRELIIWENVYLSWSPGNDIITASFEGKKATTKGKELVPEHLKSKLFGKKKSATAEKVKVEPVGNSYRIIEIL